MFRHVFFPSEIIHLSGQVYYRIKGVILKQLIQPFKTICKPSVDAVRKQTSTLTNLPRIIMSLIIKPLKELNLEHCF